MYQIKTQVWHAKEPGDIEYVRRTTPEAVIDYIEHAPFWNTQIVNILHIGTNTLYTPLQFVSLHSSGRRNV